MKTTYLIGIAVVLLVIAALMLSLQKNNQQQKLYSITNFKDCAAAGYPIMESYPEQCATPDGRTFVNEEQSNAIPEPATTTVKAPTKCIVAGCSSQLCVASDEPGTVSTCEYRAEYACYRSARCEVQQSGLCGWTQTSELKNCLKNPPKMDSTPTPVY